MAGKELKEGHQYLLRGFPKIIGIEGNTKRQVEVGDSAIDLIKALVVRKQVTKVSYIVDGIEESEILQVDSDGVLTGGFENLSQLGNIDLCSLVIRPDGSQLHIPMIKFKQDTQAKNVDEIREGLLCYPGVFLGDEIGLAYVGERLVDKVEMDKFIKYAASNIPEADFEYLTESTDMECFFLRVITHKDGRLVIPRVVDVIS